MRPVTTCTPALLAMIAADWSAAELRAAIACLIEVLDARDDDPGSCDGVRTWRLAGGTAPPQG